LFLFWLLVSFTALLEEKKRKIIDLQIFPLRALGFTFFLVLILISGISLAILYSQKYLGEVRYTQGLRAWQRGEIELSRDYLYQATNLNPKMDLYWRDLSQIFLFQLQGLLTRTDLNQQEMISLARNLIEEAVNSANQATVVDPNNVANWNIRGFVYRNLIGIVGGAEDWALISYERAKELEPVNPYIFTEIGRVYLLKSDLLAQQGNQEQRTENLKKAKESFEKAIKLKSDYAPAHFQIAMIYIRENKINQAIERLESTKAVAPFDSGLAFQLGLVYYNNNQFDKAKAEFERAILIDPNYSNARYFLGLILDREGKKKEAILQFEEIEKFNPENQEVKKILSNLRAGKPALEEVIPGQPPIEEKPAEQLEK
jgi:tetratricopeptide (TPR) repeat protein